MDEFFDSDIYPDVINICTPNGMHSSQSLLALEHCNVLVEKPMALSVDDANSLIQKEKESNNQLFCVMQNRYSPPAVWLKSLIENNVLGKIYMVNLNCFWNRDSRYYNSEDWRGTMGLDGGTLFTQFLRQHMKTQEELLVNLRQNEGNDKKKPSIVWDIEQRLVELNLTSIFPKYTRSLDILTYIVVRGIYLYRPPSGTLYCIIF